MYTVSTVDFTKVSIESVMVLYNIVSFKSKSYKYDMIQKCLITVYNSTIY